jgi:hypothetical protein
MGYVLLTMASPVKVKQSIPSCSNTKVQVRKSMSGQNQNFIDGLCILYVNEMGIKLFILQDI